MKRIILFVALVAVGCVLHGCRDKGALTVLFTSDVKGRLAPAG
jgi:hypothetical protein